MSDGSESQIKKGGRIRRYVSCKEWEAWLLKEWYPFKNNDLHEIKRDIVWIKYLVGGMVLALITAAIAILSRG